MLTEEKVYSFWPELKFCMAKALLAETVREKGFIFISADQGKGFIVITVHHDLREGERAYLLKRHV